MKSRIPWTACLMLMALLLTTAFASSWSNEDHEIFDIVEALEKAEGKGTTFYSFLNVSRSATEKEVARAYRKRSLELHPDKNPNDKRGGERFAKLGVINNILKDSERRARYDFFLTNGFPKWRGTGYYYSRYRPGLVGVLVSLAAFTCAIQYLFFWLQYKVGQQKVHDLRVQALEAAWGPGKKPLAGKRRLKSKPMEGGPTMEMMVEGENVYIVENGRETLVQGSFAPEAKWSNTWIPSLVKSTLRGKKTATSATNTEDEGEGEVEVVVGKDSKTGKTKTIKVKKPKGVQESAAKVGGRRRKVMPTGRKSD